MSKQEQESVGYGMEHWPQDAVSAYTRLSTECVELSTLSKNRLEALKKAINWLETSSEITKELLNEIKSVVEKREVTNECSYRR